MVAKRNLKQDDKKKSDLLLNIKEEVLPIVFKDPYLTPYINYFNDIRDQVSATTRRLTENKCTLWEFATAHKYFGLHLEINENNEEEWVLRECAPNATDIYLIGDFSDWNSLPESYEYNWDNSQNCWSYGVWVDGVCYKTEEGSYKYYLQSCEQLQK